MRALGSIATCISVCMLGFFNGFFAQTTTASAAVIEATLTGKVYDGIDGGNLFHVPGGDLNNYTATITYIYDTSRGTASLTNQGYSLNLSGQNIGYATIAINGYTVTVGTSSAFPVSAFGYYNSAVTMNSAVNAEYFDDKSVLQSTFIEPDRRIPLNLIQTGYFDNPASGYALFQSGGTDVALDLYTLNISVLDVAAIPLPASAPLFGFALIALVGLDRARRRQSSASAS